MASKNKRGAENSPPAGQTLRREVDRLMAKGWYKDAIKQAKLLHRAEPTSEHHQLLERAYLQRAEELRDGGMTNAAQEVASHLLDFKITDPEITERAATLLMAVGLGRESLELQGRLDSPEAMTRLARQAADQAVLHPERAKAASTETVEVAGRVRAALEALTTTEGSPNALDGLHDVSRTSPFADWRLFSRGLAAFRRGDDAETKANWDRLDPDRAAARIARALSGAIGSALRDGRPSAKVEALERRAFGEPILGSLRELADLVAQGHWPEAVRKLGPVRLALRRVDQGLAVRLTQALYALVIREAIRLPFREGHDLLKSFSKSAESLPIDPRWNRFWALAWEGPQGHPEEAQPFWRQYLVDLEASPAVRSEERPLARAIVLAHQGAEWADLAEQLDDDDGPSAGGGDGEAMDARRTAVALLEESLALDPSRRATYQTLMDLYESAGKAEKAAEVAERLVRARPDDFEALAFLVDHHLDRDEPGRALEFVLRARKLKPLDTDLLADESACRTNLARHLALKGQPIEARAELAAAVGLRSELAELAHIAAQRACVEFKADQPASGQAILDEAIDRADDPAPIRLAMAIEARRYRLSEAEVDRFEGLWRNSALAKARGETAGELAGLLANFWADGVAYPGRGEHTKQVMDYIKRTTRVKFTREALSRVCAFLGLVPDRGDLLEKMVKRGMKLFPEATEFPFIMGSIEMEKGPVRGNLRQARKHFETALKLAEVEAATNPRVAGMIRGIKDALTAVNAVLDQSRSFGFPGFPGGGPPAAFMEEFKAMMDEFEDDKSFGPDGDDERPGPARAPLPRPPQPRPKRKKR